MTLSPGDSVPAVTATNQHGETVELSFADPTVLFFYPKDDTPGCTTEACQFDTELSTFREAGVAVYGVSTDDVESHEAFAAKHGLGYDLLADPDGELVAAFDVDASGGRADRTTYVLADGEVKRVYTGVRPDGHAREVGLDLFDDGLAKFPD
ncbi:peroxiredoxin [Halobacteriales archaeon QS_1_68_17]|nr:MAG: peroxiredoxin [Halobacteriales archaeon QS_1_68_17]